MPADRPTLSSGALRSLVSLAWPFGVALLPLLAPASATRAQQPAATRLSAEEVARRTERTSFELVAEQRAQDAARAGVEQANAGYLPRVTGLASYTRLSEIDNPALGNLVLAPGADPGPLPAGSPLIAAPLSFPSVLDQYQLKAQLALPLSDYLLRVPHAIDAAEANEDAAVWNKRAVLARVKADARVLYYSWLRSKLQLTVAEQTLAQTQAHHVDAQRLAEVGMVSQADVLAAEAQVGQSELLLERARNLVGLNEARLRTAMHDESGASYEIGEDVAGDAGAAPARDANQLVQSALAGRAELKALRANEGALGAQAKLARAANLPRLDGVAEAAYANPSPRVFPQGDEWNATWAAGVQLSWTPTDIAAASAQGRAADARALQLAAQRQAVEDAIRVEIARALQNEREAAKAIETGERRLRAAEEAYRVRTLLFQNGRATGVELTDTETELTRARLAAIEARVELRVARVELAHAAALDQE